MATEVIDPSRGNYQKQIVVSNHWISSVKFRFNGRRLWMVELLKKFNLPSPMKHIANHKAPRQD